MSSQRTAQSPSSSNVVHPSAVLAPVEEVVAAIGRGEIVVLVDGPDWASEGDLVVAGELVDAGAINFMATHGRGLVRMAMEPERLAELAIPPMPRRNGEGETTALHMGVDARSGTGSGISAADRARTARALADPATTPDALAMPGHLFPVAADTGGRRGHAEAAVQLTRLAGLAPAAVICEIADADGRMARLPRLVDFADEHGLLIGSVKHVAELARRHSRIERVVSTALPVHGATFTAIGYLDHGDGREHMALVFGDAIRHEGRGVVVYLREHDEHGADLFAHADDERDDAAAAAILRDLGVRSIRLLSAGHERSRAMERQGIDVTSCTPLHGSRAAG
jgi:3,4-dihydroxy 2-butanone 4-phosphate synthase/GTP cyclohydrolase II